MTARAASPVAARVALATVALALAVWCAIGFRDARLIADVSKTAIARHPTPAQLHQALSDVHDSRLLNPDATEAARFDAQLYIRLGSYPAARDRLEEVVRGEPENRNAWIQLAKFTERRDPALSARAQAQVRALDPLPFRSQR